MPSIIATIQNQWQSLKSKGLYQYWWENSVETTTYPPVRQLEVAFTRLYRKNGQAKDFVGTFIPELFLLANTVNGSLRCQVEEQAWIKERSKNNEKHDIATLAAQKPELYKALYRADGKRKTAFELSVFPIHKLSDIQKVITAEFKYRNKHGLALPPIVPRIRIQPDYLQPDEQGNLGNSGLTIGDNEKDGQFSVYVNLWNTSSKATSREKVLHYLFNWVAFGGAFSYGISALGMASGLGGMTVLFAATFFATICAQICSMYDISERILRDARWFSSPDFKPWHGKLSITSSLIALLKMAAIAIPLYGVVTNTFATFVGASWLFPTMILGTTLAGLATVALAGFMTAMTGVSAYVGLTLTMRYIFGLSIYDNKISVTKEMADSLPIVQKHSPENNTVPPKPQLVPTVLVQFKLDKAAPVAQISHANVSEPIPGVPRP